MRTFVQRLFSRRAATAETGQEMDPGGEKPPNCCVRMYNAIPARVIVAIMCFTASWCSYMLRINLSLALVAMVKPANPDDDAPDYGTRFDWSQSIQGQLLAAYFYGSVVSHIPGGMLAELVGPRIVITVTSILGGVFTILLPFTADWGIGWIIAARVFIGLNGGMLYPSLHALVAQWSPPQEKSKFVWSLLGGTFGTVVTWPILAQIIEHMGWRASFYILGGIAVGWTLIWIVLIYDAPSKHPRIHPEELEYITSSIAGTVSTEKRVLPILSVMTSCPYLALVVLHFGNLGGLFFQMTEGPKYMSEFLGFKLSLSGALASLPYLMRLLFGFVFSALGDWLLARPDANKTLIRKMFVIPSHIIPGLLMAGLGYVTDSAAVAVALLSLALGSNGAATVSNLANHHDLAPNYAGSLYGIMNAFGTCTGFIFPAIVGVILEAGNTQAQWQIIFFIGSGLYLLSGVVFMIFGSAVTQSWNFKEE